MNESSTTIDESNVTIVELQADFGSLFSAPGKQKDWPDIVLNIRKQSTNVNYPEASEEREIQKFKVISEVPTDSREFQSLSGLVLPGCLVLAKLKRENDRFWLVFSDCSVELGRI